MARRRSFELGKGAPAASPSPLSSPLRTCAGCRQTAGKKELLRLVRAGSEIVLDLPQRAAGRGAYLHPLPACWELARRRRSLERSLKGSVGASTWNDIITNSTP